MVSRYIRGRTGSGEYIRRRTRDGEYIRGRTEDSEYGFCYVGFFSSIMFYNYQYLRNKNRVSSVRTLSNN